MGHENLLSYYPNYAILDEVSSNPKYNTLNLFIDLKNTLQTIYMKFSIINILESSLKSKRIDTSVFASLISFLSFHKMYGIRRNKMNINYFIFLESGISYYHTNISKKYKVSRRIDDLYGLEKDKRDYFFEILGVNYKLIEGIGNRLPNTKVIRLQNLEADFVPYYIISRELIPQGENVANIIYSNDHDMLQCINDNTSIFFRSNKIKKIVKKGEVVSSYSKQPKKFPDEYLTFIMSILGDPGDNVDGIKGIGIKRLEEILEDLVEMVGGIDTLKQNVFLGNPIFNTDRYKNKNKYIDLVLEKELNDQVISNNMKLVDFEILSRFLEIPVKTEMIEKRKQITNVLESNEKLSLNEAKELCSKLRIFLQEEDLDTIYYKYGE